MCTYLCTYCEIWMINASTYFCIFVPPIQEDIKLMFVTIVSSFLRLWKEEPRSGGTQSAFYWDRLVKNTHFTPQLWNCAWHAFYNIWIFPHCISLTHNQLQPNEIIVGPWEELDSFPLMLGFGWVGGSGTVFVRAVVRTPLLCVQWLCCLSDRPLKTSWERRLTIKSRLGCFSLLSPQGYPPCSRLGGRVQGGWRAKGRRNECFKVLRPGYWLTFLCKVPPLFFCLFSLPLSVSCTPPCSSIWFNLREMFIFLLKYPFITLGMELDVLLVWTVQITMPPRGCCSAWK